MQAEPLLDDAAPTLVLYGDVPLIRPSTLQRLFTASGDVALLTVQLAQPAGYGRIVRDWHGNVLRIVEERDANDDERKLTEVNTGILMAPTVEAEALAEGAVKRKCAARVLPSRCDCACGRRALSRDRRRMRRSRRNTRRQQQGAIGDDRAHRTAAHRR